jgi:manganese efflux pump family protein
MSFLEIFILAIGLSMDCFAVSITLCSSQKQQWRRILVMALLFGLFQGLMPLVGWLVGSYFETFIESIDHWLAFGILAFIGIRMIIESFHLEKEKKVFHIGKIYVLLGLSVATSLNALATGIGFGFIRVNILEAVVTISAVTFIVTMIGARLGDRSRIIPARWAEFAGGIVLILIGVKIVLSHLGVF